MCTQSKEPAYYTEIDVHVIQEHLWMCVCVCTVAGIHLHIIIDMSAYPTVINHTNKEGLHNSMRLACALNVHNNCTHIQYVHVYNNSHTYYICLEHRETKHTNVIHTCTHSLLFMYTQCCMYVWFSPCPSVLLTTLPS